MKKLLLVAGMLALTVSVLKAHEGEDHDKEGQEMEMTDEMIEKKKSSLDADLAKRVEMIEKEFAEMQALETDLKDSRIAFERKHVSELKSFLDTLAGKSEEERRDAMKAFHRQQRDAREDFQDSQRDKRHAFMKARKERMHERKDEMKESRKERREERKHKD